MFYPSEWVRMIATEEPRLVLTLPVLPPSGNNYKGIARNGRVFVRPPARKFKAHMGRVFDETAPDYWQPIPYECAIFVVFHVGPKTRLDLDNHLKVLADSLNGKAWVDDSLIMHNSSEKVIITPQKGQKIGDILRTTIYIYA